MAAIFVFSEQTFAAQTVPYKVNFQGRLANNAGTAMADGQYNMKFRLYSVSSGGVAVWEELRETTNRVQVTNGLFSVQLGDVTALSPSVFTTQPLYFEVELPTTGTATCNTASCATFNGTEIMSPRHLLGASPYAMNADTLDGIDAPSFARRDANNTYTGTQTFGNSLIFTNSNNAYTVTVNSGITAANFAMTLPTNGATGAQCLKSTSGSTASATALEFASCGAGSGGNLQDAYNATGTASPHILLSSTNGGIKIRDAETPISGNLFTIQNYAATASYLGVTSSAVTLQDSNGYNAFVFDSSTSHLKVYENIASPVRFADVYFDDATGEAVYAASSGSSTRVGNGSGHVTISLTAQADLFSYTKTTTLGSAYSSDDMTVRRNITAGSNALTGSVLRVESISAGSSTVASNILWLNENNTSATGNLILATTGGAGNDKFKVNTSGTATIAAGQSYTGAGAVTLSSAAASALTVQSGNGTVSLGTSTAVTANAALAISASGTNNLTLQSGGTGSVILKPGTNSAAAITMQNSTGGSMLTVDTTTSGTQLGTLVVGSATTDANIVLLQLDSYNAFASEPTCGTTTNQGGLYYNTAVNSIRGCVNGAWEDMPSTAGLGIFLFGVVPDSGSNPGDLAALTTTGVTGPCKVSWTSVTTVTIAPCTAYSGGRKVIVPSTVLNTNTISGANITTLIWSPVCLTGTNNQPAFGAAGTEVTTTGMPTFSINNPVLCLAHIKLSTATLGNIAQIYDTRTFINTQKEFMTMSTAAALGQVVCPATNHAAPCNLVASRTMGVVVATTGGTSTTSPAAIIATNGPTWVKGNTGTAGQLIINTTTAGYAATTNTDAFNSYGTARSAIVTTCTTAATCLGSMYANFKGR